MNQYSPNTNIVLDPKTQDVFISDGIKICYKKNDFVVDINSSIEGLYLIDSGQVNIISYSIDGREKNFGILSKGCVFPFAAFFSETLCSNYYQARTKLTVYYLSKSKIDYLLKRNDEFRKDIIRYISSVARSFSLSLESMTFQSARERLLNLFYSTCNLTDDNNSEWITCNQKFTTVDLSSILGVSRMTISNCMNALYEEELIRIVNKKIQIRKRRSP